MSATRCTSSDPTKCTRRLHDHRGQVEAAQNGTGTDTGADWLVCGDCDLPMHYDYGDEQYHHDDPTAPACHMIPAEVGS
jgi:hypothetical protein